MTRTAIASDDGEPFDLADTLKRIPRTSAPQVVRRKPNQRLAEDDPDETDPGRLAARIPRR